MRDLTVLSRGVRLAVRDFGGTGSAVLLLHGLGRTLVDWSVFGPLMSSMHRTVALDLRGHGESGDGPWSWGAALPDIDAVASELEVDAPAVVGHSLGGMLAVMWARAHPKAPAVVNLDGHGRRSLSQYVGIDPGDARRRIGEAEERVKASIGALSGPLPLSVVDGLLSQQRALAAQFGAPEEMFVESINRTLRREGDVAFLRPSPSGLGGEILADAAAFDMFALYAEVRCPVLVVAGTEPDAGVDQELMAAYRAGLRRDLEALTTSCGNVSVEFVKGGHGLLFEHPEDLVKRVEAFLSR
jgi:pimeloyl-ACP methyl ester carboxylesterase